MQKWDLFVSYAAEDRVPLVDALVGALRMRGLKVWLDRDELAIGDSITHAIESGLARRDFGLVVLTERFLSRNWPKRELRALLDREERTGSVIVPILHDVSPDEVRQISPVLASVPSLSITTGADAVASGVLQRIQEI